MKTRTLWLLLIAVGLISVPAEAAPLCTSYTTMSQLEALGAGGCQFAGFLFYNFSYSDTITVGTVTSPTPSSGSAPQIASSDVLVTFDNSVLYRPTMILTVDQAAGGDWSATGAGTNDSIASTQSAASTSDIRISYAVTALTPTLIAGAGIGIEGSATWDYGPDIALNRQGQFRSTATVGEGMTPTAPNGPTINPQASIAPSKPGANDPTVFNLSSVSPFDIADIPVLNLATLSGSANIGKDVLLTSGKGSVNSVRLTQIDEILVTNTPEPGSMVVMSGGMALIALWGYLRRKEVRDERA
jgi:hypothetical protein